MRLRPRLSGATWGVLAVLVLAMAGLTHVVSVLALPWRSHRDAFARIAALAPIGSWTALPDVGTPGEPIPFRDPRFVAGVCRYDLRLKPFRLALTPFESGFLTVGFHSRHGLGFYGLTVRAADTTRLDLRLTDKGEARPAGADPEQHTVSVEAPEPEGFVLVATPAGDDGDTAEARQRLTAVQCLGAAPP